LTFNAIDESSLERRKILGRATDLIVTFFDLSCQNLKEDWSNIGLGTDRDDDLMQAYAS